MLYNYHIYLLIKCKIHIYSKTKGNRISITKGKRDEIIVEHTVNTSITPTAYANTLCTPPQHNIKKIE